MPDIENSRKTAEKGAEWVTVKQAKNSRKKQPKHPKNSCFDCFSAVFRVFRLFFGCFTVTHSAPFSPVFRLFSMSGIWHLCAWPRRLPRLDSFQVRFGLVLSTVSEYGTVPLHYPIYRIGFGRMDFSRIFIFGPPVFFRSFFSRGYFLLIFVGKKHPEKSSRKILCKIFRN